MYTGGDRTAQEEADVPQQEAITAGARVRLRSDWPVPWTVTEDLVSLNGIPAVYEVTGLEPEHAIEVTGGTATIGTRVTVRPAGSPGPEMTVPAGRIVPGTAAPQAHP
jgi:hypothetical protein